MHWGPGKLWLGLLILGGLSSLGAQEAGSLLVIRGGTLIDGTGKPPQRETSVLIEDGKIRTIGTDLKIPPNATIIDATGKFLVPGLIDARVRIGPTPGNHISRSEVGIDQRLDSLRALLAAGVSTARLIQGDIKEQKLYQRWWKEDLLVSPRIVTTGPVFTAKGGHPVDEYSLLAVEARDRETRQIADEDEVRPKTREITHAGVDSLEIDYDKGLDSNTKPRLDKSLLEILIAEGHGFDLPVFCEVGSNQEAEEVAVAGANVVEGAWEETLTEGTLATMARKEVFFLPAMTQQGDLLNLLDEPALKAYLDQPIVQKGLSSVLKESLANTSGLIGLLRKRLGDETGEIIRRQLEQQEKRAFDNVRRAKAAGVRIAIGTGSGNLLVFPGAALHRELQLLVKAGLTPLEAIVAATRDTAISLGHGDELGTLEPGKRADLLILDADPLVDIRNTEKIHKVIQSGREVRARDLQMH